MLQALPAGTNIVSALLAEGRAAVCHTHSCLLKDT